MYIFQLVIFGLVMVIVWVEKATKVGDDGI